MKTIPSPPGVFDIIPDDQEATWRQSHIWQHVEATIRETARCYGYHEIRTPIFERAELFQRGVGETSDIVSKELYLFEDKGDRMMALRPEGTAPVMRAFIENNLASQGQQHKLFYIGPMFRYDRPQAGRYRQHHQFGVEAVGVRTPEQDAEILDFLLAVYKKLGLKKLNVFINSLGTNECRLKYRTKLQEYLKPFYNELSEDSQKRFEGNPLRILDSKDLKDREIIANAPSILDHLNDESREYFQLFKANLDLLGIPYIVNHNLVRGLDYYNQTVFEIVAGELGAQNSIGGGGRYDGLLKLIGGPDLPAMGFGAGIERLIQVMVKQEVVFPTKPAPLIFLIPLGDEARAQVFQLTHHLRQKGIAAQMDLSGRKLNKVMQYADQIGATFVTVIGAEELASETIELKEMATGEKSRIPLSSLPKIMMIESKSKAYMEMLAEMEEPLKQAQESEFFISRLKHAVETTQRATDKLYEQVQKMKEMMEK